MGVRQPRDLFIFRINLHNLSKFVFDKHSLFV